MKFYGRVYATAYYLETKKQTHVAISADVGDKHINITVPDTELKSGDRVEISIIPKPLKAGAVIEILEHDLHKDNK